jgi:tetratricopeptide (TPR) repeat protein
MGSTHSTENGLEQGLAALETFGLVRPPNVLLTEYLSALMAEDVLDALGAGRIADAYNRARYATDAGDPVDVSDVTTSLQHAAARLAAMTDEERQQLAQRIRDRFETPAEVEPYAGNRNSEVVARNAPVPLTRQVRFETEQGSDPLRSNAQNVYGDPFAASVHSSVWWRSALRRRTLELSAIVALAIFFFGYFFRELANKSIDPEFAAEAGEKKSKTGVRFSSETAQNMSQFPRALANAVYSHGLEETRTKQFDKARLAFEFLLAYSPDDPYVLNNLAWVYLFPDEAGTTNPQRAVQLVSRALHANRIPAFLDTAAEAQFQCGHRHEAIRLEQEAMLDAYDNPETAPNDLATYQKQLERYRNSPDSTPANPNRRAADW